MSHGNFVLISEMTKKKKKKVIACEATFEAIFAFVFFSCKDLFSVNSVSEDRCEKPQFFITVLSQATFRLLWSLTETQICAGRQAGKCGFRQKTLDLNWYSKFYFNFHIQIQLMLISCNFWVFNCHFYIFFPNISLCFFTNVNWWRIIKVSVGEKWIFTQ